MDVIGGLLALGSVALGLLGIVLAFAPLWFLAGHGNWDVIYAVGMVVVCVFLLGAIGR